MGDERSTETSSAESTPATGFAAPNPANANIASARRTPPAPGKPIEPAGGNPHIATAQVRDRVPYGYDSDQIIDTGFDGAHEPASNAPIDVESEIAQLEALGEEIAGLRDRDPERGDVFALLLETVSSDLADLRAGYEPGSGVSEVRRLIRSFQAQPPAAPTGSVPAREPASAHKLSGKQTLITEHEVRIDLTDELNRATLTEWAERETQYLPTMPGGSWLREGILEQLAGLDELVLGASARTKDETRLETTDSMRAIIREGIKANAYNESWVAYFYEQYYAHDRPADLTIDEYWPTDNDGQPWQCDHILELWQGGDDALENYLPIDATLHRIKSEVLGRLRHGFFTLIMKRQRADGDHGQVELHAELPGADGPSWTTDDGRSVEPLRNKALDLDHYTDLNRKAARKGKGKGKAPSTS